MRFPEEDMISLPDRTSIGVSAGALFVYGTLQFPEVIKNLIDRVPSMRPARLSDHLAAKLIDRVYPGLVEVSGYTTDGFVIDGLTADDWKILDRFEDFFYELVPVSVTVEQHSTIRAVTYRLPPDSPIIELNNSWSRSEFANLHLDEYGPRCAE